MQHSDIAARGLVLLGCGKMGSAMLEGWLAGGLPPASVWVTDWAVWTAYCGAGVSGRAISRAGVTGGIGWISGMVRVPKKYCPTPSV